MFWWHWTDILWGGCWRPKLKLRAENMYGLDLSRLFFLPMIGMWSGDCIWAPSINLSYTHPGEANRGMAPSQWPLYTVTDTSISLHSPIIVEGTVVLLTWTCDSTTQYQVSSLTEDERFTLKSIYVTKTPSYVVRSRTSWNFIPLMWANTSWGLCGCCEVL